MPAAIETMRRRYREGVGWGEVKDELARVVNDYLRAPRGLYTQLMAEPQRIDDLLAAGAVKARRVARDVVI